MQIDQFFLLYIPCFYTFYHLKTNRMFLCALIYNSFSKNKQKKIQREATNAFILHDNILLVNNRFHPLVSSSKHIYSHSILNILIPLAFLHCVISEFYKLYKLLLSFFLNVSIEGIKRRATIRFIFMMLFLFFLTQR